MVGRIYPLLPECGRLRNVNKNTLRLCPQSVLPSFCYLIQRTLVSEQNVLTDFTGTCVYSYRHTYHFSLTHLNNSAMYLPQFSCL